MKKKTIIIAVILVVIVGAALGYTLLRKGNENGTLYKIEALKRGDLQALVVTTGTLNPVITVDVGSQVSGKIANLYVDFNSTVKKGQVIAELDPEFFLTRVKQDEANYRSSVASLEGSKVTLDNTKRQLDRALSMFEKELISYEEKEASETQYYSAKANLQSAEARLEQVKSQLDSSKVDLSYTVIKSPIDGVVINRAVNIGQTVAASLQAPILFQIANDLSKMQVECSVDEADIGKVKEDQDVTFTVDAFTEDQFSGKVAQVRYSPQVVQNVVTYTTIVELENPDLKLRPGMTATVSIVVGEAKDKILVPNSALRFTPDLSQEEIMELFQAMRQMRGGQSGQSQQSDGQRERSNVQRSSSPPSGFQGQGGMRGSGRHGSRQASRVWMQDESGNLQIVMIRTGVTDNNYTEVISGDLKEGQEVITGAESTSSSRRSSSMGSMMRMMR
jgi:HlyD family secretion protein